MRRGSIWTVHEDGGAVLHLRGEVDDIAVSEYEAAARTSGGSGAHRGVVVAVEASAVTFMNAAALRFVLRETAPLVSTGRRPVLRRPSRPVRLVLELADLSDVFTWQ